VRYEVQERLTDADSEAFGVLRLAVSDGVRRPEPKTRRGEGD
jgi:hypothetical protein